MLSVRERPVGCRFYFDPNWGYPRMTMEITSRTYATPTAAYDAMVRIGQRGANGQGLHGLVPGVDGVLYQTRFYPPDGDDDWACTFAKGNKMVTVKTDQTNVSLNARQVATLIAGKF